MLDWLTLHLPVVHDIASTEGDVFLTLGPSGDVIREFRAARSLAGSWESAVRVSTVSISEDGASGTVLRIDGNPSKWLQGHNLDSPESVDFLLAFCESVCSALGAGPIKQADWLNADIYRLDITRSWDLGSESAVLDWIHAAERSVTLSHRGHGNLSKGSTIYWGKSSRRWSIKCYPKGRELRAAGRRPKLGTATVPALEWARGLLRVELVVRRMHLVALGVTKIRDLSDKRFARIFEMHVEKLNVADRITPRWDRLDGLTASERLAVQAWADGHRLRELLPRSSFYRVRKKVLDQTGVDVASPAPRGGDVVPLLRPLEAKPAERPEFLQSRIWDRAAPVRVVLPIAA